MLISKEDIILITAIFLLFNLDLTSASCSEEQININTASLEELDEISHVGIKVAGYIIDARPFSSLEELVDVSYISENYLNDIKSQGLACVEDEISEEDKTDIESDEDEGIKVEELENDNKLDNENNELNYLENELPLNINTENLEITAEVINLVPKDIKNTNNSESSEKSIYAIYGFIIFCSLLALLFLLKFLKNRKNEFR